MLILRNKTVLNVIVSYLASFASTEKKPLPTINIFKLHMLNKEVQITLRAIFYDSLHFGTYHDYDSFYEMMLCPKNQLS